ncbi:MAG: HEPN domain-containing protein [Actinobacteria bacterium]|nr:HEPN domain-containing protein [Actinomycetota bacterium]
MEQAKFDLEVANWNAKGQYWSEVCFKCQQAGEKALKAFLYAQGRRTVLGHSLVELIRECAKYSGDFVSLEKGAKKLDKYYIITRYPNGLPGLTPADYFEQSEAEEAIALAKSVVDTVESKLPGI